MARLFANKSVASFRMLSARVPAEAGASNAGSLFSTSRGENLDIPLIGVLVSALLFGALLTSIYDKSFFGLIKPLNGSELLASRMVLAPSYSTGKQGTQERNLYTSYLTNVIQKGSKLSEDGASALAQIIVRESAEAGFDPLFVAAIVKSESAFNNMAVSNRGAVGLMQVMPATGKYISDRTNMSWLGSDRLHNERYNVQLGLSYLRYLQRQFNGDIRSILIAYNWGPANLQSAMRKGTGVPRMSIAYADKIISNHAAWRSDLDVQLANLTLGISSSADVS